MGREKKRGKESRSKTALLGCGSPWKKGMTLRKSTERGWNRIPPIWKENKPAQTAVGEHARCGTVAAWKKKRPQGEKNGRKEINSNKKTALRGALLVGRAPSSFVRQGNLLTMKDGRKVWIWDQQQEGKGKNFFLSLSTTTKLGLIIGRTNPRWW